MNNEITTIANDNLLFFSVEPAINDIAINGVKFGKCGTSLERDAIKTVVPIKSKVFLFIVVF
jgi:hypothetical protein